MQYSDTLQLQPCNRLRRWGSQQSTDGIPGRKTEAIPIESSQVYGIDPELVESITFAWPRQADVKWTLREPANRNRCQTPGNTRRYLCRPFRT